MSAISKTATEFHYHLAMESLDKFIYESGCSDPAAYVGLSRALLDQSIIGFLTLAEDDKPFPDDERLAIFRETTDFLLNRINLAKERHHGRRN